MNFDNLTIADLGKLTKQFKRQNPEFKSAGEILEERNLKIRDAWPTFK